MPLGEKTKLLWQNPKYRQHMSDIKKGKIYSNSFHKGHKIRNTGRTRFKKGHQKTDNWYLAMQKLKGSANHKWKGKNVLYGALHDWLRRTYGILNICENKNCIYPRTTAAGKILKKPVRFEWANIDGIYARERKHWVRLCASCHRLFDNGKIKL
jgi:hypothetical protein